MRIQTDHAYLLDRLVEILQHFRDTRRTLLSSILLPFRGWKSNASGLRSSHVLVSYLGITRAEDDSLTLSLSHINALLDHIAVISIYMIQR